MTVPGNLSSPLLATAAAAAAGAGPIKSVRFESANSAFLNRTPSSSGNRKKYTWSTWVKRSSTASWILTVGTSADTESIYFNGGHLVMARYVGSFQYYLETEASFLDFSSFYHIVVAHDHSLSTSTDRIKLYVNGVRITDFKSGATFPPQNSEYETNSTENHKIGRYANAYLADLYFIDDQQLDHTSFAALDANGVWQASAFSGSFGTNGFHLFDFASESGIGSDSSGNDNDFTVNNIQDGNTGTATAELLCCASTSSNTATVANTGNSVSANGTVTAGSYTINSNSTGANDFNGSNGYLKVTASTSYAPSSAGQPWTAEAFVKFDSFSNYPCVLEWNQASTGKYFVPLQHNGATFYCNASGTGADFGCNGSHTASTGTWYHMVAVCDGSRISTYIDGTRIATTTYSGNLNVIKDYDTYIGAFGFNGGVQDYVDGQISNLRWTLAANYDPSQTSITVPDVPLSSSISGAIFGGPEINDVLFDVPTNGDAANDTGAGGELSSNYPTMNPLAKNSNTTLTNGNLDVSSTAVYTTLSTIAFPSTGKFYAEFRINGTASGYPFVGIGGFNDTGIFSNANPNTGAFYAQGGYVTGSVSVSSLTALSAGDIVGVAYDTSNGKVWFSINGTYVSSGDPANGTNATCTLSANASGYCLATSTYQAGTVSLNAGQRAFNTNAPSGFKCLCTSNLPTPTIADGSDHFLAKAYTGNGSSLSISTGFSPDLVWLKHRAHGEHHGLFDTQRGPLMRIVSDYNYASTSRANSLTSFNSDGFSLGSAGEYNGSNESHIAWAWNAGENSNKTYTVKVVSDSGNKYRFDDFGTSAVTLDLAEGSTYVFDQSDSSNSGHPLRFSTTSDGTHGGGSEYTTGVTTTGTPGSAGAKTTIVVAASAPTLYYYCSVHSGMGGQADTNSTTGSSNFDGSIQATVKANQTAGFSIVTWTAASGNPSTLGHSLNAVPEFVITRTLTGTQNWAIYSKALGSFDRLLRFNSSSYLTSSGYWGTSAQWTSSTFCVYPTANTGDNNWGDMIAYCFTPVAGFSAMGSYDGNGNADGSFVHLGFRPRWIMLKNSTSAYSWYIYDTARAEENPAQVVLIPNAANADTTDADYSIDILSNGFKARTNNIRSNGSSDTYVYLAFAENPFQANGGLAR